jgi:hypothetical protein
VVLEPIESEVENARERPGRMRQLLVANGNVPPLLDSGPESRGNIVIVVDPRGLESSGD